MSILDVFPPPFGKSGAGVCLWYEIISHHFIDLSDKKTDRPNMIGYEYIRGCASYFWAILNSIIQVKKTKILIIFRFGIDLIFLVF